MKQSLLAFGAFLALSLGALPSMAACPIQSQFYPYSTSNSCCPTHIVAPCCPAPVVSPCCPNKCVDVCPAAPIQQPCCQNKCFDVCPAAPIQQPCCEPRETCDDCCD